MRVVVLDDYQDIAASYTDWGDLDPVSITEHIADEGALAEALAGAEIVVAMRERTPFPASLFDRLPDLKLLVTTGNRNAVIDLDAAAAHGVTVCGTMGIVTSTSELTWALILAVRRHIAADDATIRNGGWQTRLGTGLAGQRLGLIGLGNIGGLMSKVGVAFGMDVVAWSQNLTQEKADRFGIRAVSKTELIETSDVVSLHLQLSERTHHIIGAAELVAMKPSAILVNTSRGPLIDQPALADALRRHIIAGAGLDVYEHEPLPVTDPLRALPNTVLTPHTGYVVSQCYDIFYREIVEDIVAWRAGEPVRLLTPR
ncbi:MAG: D-isomer specific 2-hydroxyacid dehydrogenase NAD-binding protein [Ilumatobacteraceae bacterium]|nr:D-isomer specific 2-hydroxyacid dehydrogenase NAD-binding protein [Ilumatobacteraceae bacterium]